MSDFIVQDTDIYFMYKAINFTKGGLVFEYIKYAVIV